MSVATATDTVAERREKTAKARAAFGSKFSSDEERSAYFTALSRKAHAAPRVLDADEVATITTATAMLAELFLTDPDLS
jgi:hypothetical protein